MERLRATTSLAPDVHRPAYDRAALTPGIVHIGIGAFHRAHQAVYTDAALDAAFGPWGIVGVSLRSTEIASDLKAQDCLYSVVTRGVARDSVRVVGSVIDALAARDSGPEIIGLLSDPSIRIVTLTVSEKAYGIDPVTGGIDRAHPAIAADIETLHAPVGVIGYLTEALANRKANGTEPFTVLCCDNLPGNGHIVRRLVTEMAALRDAGLAAWIFEKGAFPSSMVDRIVPAATPDTVRRAQTLLGADDQLAIETEPFSQWIIENDFVSGRPDWEAGGALFVENVEPYEKMKLRLLNGSHSMIAYLGQLQGLEFVRDVMTVDANVQRVRRHMQAAVQTLDPVPGIDLDAYMDELLHRFANPSIAHRTKQIAMDGSQKLPQRIFAPAMEALQAGRSGKEFAYVTALWIAYLKQATSVDDPRADELLAAASAIETQDRSAAFFSVPGLFPSALCENRTWRDSVNQQMASL